MTFLKSRQGAAVLILLLLLALFLVRPGADRLRSRIVSSISLALGRQVDVGSVNIRLLPQPGFDLENFVVHDDPAFSAEPVLRAQEVMATLRVSSLLRGRLEIARLALTEPSLNLVRNDEGHWNVETLLERAARTPVAPTSKSRGESRPGFPYIQADGGRINFKFGQEKKPYALTDADFALWQDSENAWGMRLEAQPLRTDLNLTDTGTISINGSWQRAQSLRETPIQFRLQWERAQLGQLTKLVYGTDKGWRGTVKWSATLSGTPAKLAVQTDAAVQDFRRFDIVSGGTLRLAAECSGLYSSMDQSISNLACHVPVGEGMVTLDGSVNGPATYDMTVTAQGVPMQAVAAFARHAKKNLPDDLIAAGTLDASVTVKREGAADRNEAAWQGGGETTGFRLASILSNTDLIFDRIPFAVSTGSNMEPKLQNGHKASAFKFPPSSEPRVEVGPFNLALGRPAPAMVRARVSRSGYSLLLSGDAQVQKLLQAARALGVPSPQPAAEGTASVDLQIAGAWHGLIAPRAVGKIELHSLRAEVRGLNVPLEIASASLLLTEDEVRVQNLTASLAGSAWHGSVTLPRQCAGPGACPVRFDLHADQISTEKLNQLLGPNSRKGPWYRFLATSPQSGTPYLATLHAMGKLTANRVLIHKLVGAQVSANVELQQGKLRLSDLRGEVLGGRHTGEWKADFTATPPEYSGNGILDRVALGQLADAMHDAWITGTATAKYRTTASGLTTAELVSSANASVEVDARDGSLPHIVLAGAAGPLQMRRLEGRLQLRGSKLEFEAGKLETPGGIYQLSGTASLGRVLDVKLVREGGHGFNITGTLTDPRVVTATTPETQAALKP